VKKRRKVQEKPASNQNPEPVKEESNKAAGVQNVSGHQNNSSGAHVTN
jgi:hypothetical protein